MDNNLKTAFNNENISEALEKISRLSENMQKDIPNAAALKLKDNRTEKKYPKQLPGTTSSYSHACNTHKGYVVANSAAKRSRHKEYF
jgi:hypothetical protein